MCHDKNFFDLYFAKENHFFELSLALRKKYSSSFRWNICLTWCYIDSVRSFHSNGNLIAWDCCCKIGCVLNFWCVKILWSLLLIPCISYHAIILYGPSHVNQCNYVIMYSWIHRTIKCKKKNNNFVWIYCHRLSLTQ